MRTQGSLITRTRYDKSGRLSGKAIHYRDAPAEVLPLLDKTYRYDASDNLVAEVLTQTQRKGMSCAANDEHADLEKIIGRFHNLPHTGRSYSGRNRYGYDPNEQLQTVQQSRPNWQATQVEDYKYDKAGNIFDGPKLNGLIKHNRVLVYQDKRYRYDGFGRLCEKRIGSHRVQRFEYDAEQRLVCMVQEGYGEVERIVFGYDLLGRRISKAIYKQGESRPTFQTLYHWQGLRLLQEIQNGLPSLYVYANSSSYEPIARIEGKPTKEKIQYYHTNLAGLPEQLTDEHGHTIWRSDYHGWGSTRDEWHDPRHGREQNLRHQGQYLDRETGLHYNTFRYYDPDVGCFTQVDPVGLVGGLNFFQYAPNPLSWIDPLGLTCWPSARRKYWRAEAKAAPKGMYSSVNMFRMRLGLAPRIRVREFYFKTQEERTRNVSIELNHRHWPQRDGKHIHTPYNLEKVTPWEHAAKDPYRHPGSELIEVLQDLSNYKGF